MVCPYHGWGQQAGRRQPVHPLRGPSQRLAHVAGLAGGRAVRLRVHVARPRRRPAELGAPDLFTFVSHLPGEPGQYYRPYPEASVKYAGEPVHPQIPMENGPDTVHFQFVPRRPSPPAARVGTDGCSPSVAGWPVPMPGESGSHCATIAVNVGSAGRPARGADIPLGWSCSPPRSTSTSDIFYSIWWPRDVWETSTVMPAASLNVELLAAA